MHHQPHKSHDRMSRDGTYQNPLTGLAIQASFCLVCKEGRLAFAGGR
jgi:hypothetical protein